MSTSCGSPDGSADDEDGGNYRHERSDENECLCEPDPASLLNSSIVIGTKGGLGERLRLRSFSSSPFNLQLLWLEDVALKGRPSSRLALAMDIVQDIIGELIGRVEQPGEALQIVFPFERPALERVIKTPRAIAVLVVERGGRSLRAMR